jgi:hypothetical protein
MTQRTDLIVQPEKLLKPAVVDYIDRIVDRRGLRQRVITQPRPIPEVAVEILADALFAIAVPIVFTPASCRVRNSLRPINVRIADMFRMTVVWHVSKTSVLESIDSELCSNIWHSLILYPSNLTDLSRVDVRAQRDFSANFFGRNHSNSTRLE